MNNDSNNCPKSSEGQNWKILLLAGWMQGAVNMCYMPCKIPELGRSFPFEVYTYEVLTYIGDVMAKVKFLDMVGR
jgi:hypothetical protein